MKFVRSVGHACVAASFALASSNAVCAAPPAPPAPPVAPAPPAPPVAIAPDAKGKEASVYVRCDGRPDNITVGETVARLVAITALVGLLIPPHEQADMSKRLSGAAGISACTEALAKESNPTRRVQLILARAIHHLEAGENEAALADARLAETDRPDYAATLPFKLSFHLSALELQGLAFAAMGKMDEAAAKGLEMGAAAPYDFYNLLRAQRLVVLTGRFGPEESRFYDALARAYPLGLATRAYTRERAGDFRGAADDFEAWIAFNKTLSDKPAVGVMAQAALARALAGDGKQAETLAKAAQDGLQAQLADGKATDAAAATQALDFYHIVALAKAGKADQARMLFSARSAWPNLSGGAVGALAVELRQGAKPEELTGLLARDPQSFRADELARAAHELANEDGAKLRYSAIRPAISTKQLETYSGHVWGGGGSKYIAKNASPKINAQLIDVARDGGGLAAPYAILLHSALYARALGKKQFMLIPIPRIAYAEFVRFGNPGDQAMSAALAYDADRVIADLGKVIPQPSPH